MCGRVKLEGGFSEINIAFKIPDEYPAPWRNPISKFKNYLLLENEPLT